MDTHTHTNQETDQVSTNISNSFEHFGGETCRPMFRPADRKTLVMKSGGREMGCNNDVCCLRCFYYTINCDTCSPAKLVPNIAKCHWLKENTR